MSQKIAVVGIGLRFPGSTTMGEFAQNLLAKRCFVREVPPEYLAMKLGQDGQAPALAGLLDEFDQDLALTGIAPATLRGMSPSQRLALLCAREAWHDARLAQGGPSAERAAVIMAASAGCEELEAQSMATAQREIFRRLRSLAAEGDRGLLEALLARYGEHFPEHPITAESLLGRSAHLAAGWVAWALGLHGPNLTVDAACASSLAALDSAVRTLRSGDVDVALAGGVDTWTTSEAHLLFGRLGALGSHGSFPFDRRGDGFILAEGGAVVVLKRLSDAHRDGDRIYAVIEAVGSASDGAGSGITTPQTRGQFRALQRAYEQCGLDPGQTCYVECHGTGTEVGDPVELATLRQFFGPLLGPPLAIGSVKAALGHAKTAAGMAGLLAALVPLSCGLLAGQVNFEQPSPALAEAAGELRVLSLPEPLGERRRQVGVSSFGFGGTNFHIVLSAPEVAARPPMVEPSSALLGPLPVVTTDVAFLFPGQGSQYPGMLSELWDEPALAADLEMAESVISASLGKSLRAQVRGPEAGELLATDLVQPALLAVSAALLRLVRAAGVEAGMALGHSVGEYTALHAAGSLTFPQALQAVAFRGRLLMEERGPRSGLLALLGPARALASVLERFAPELRVVHRNSYEQVVLAGEEGPLETAREWAESHGVIAHRLLADRAFHSPLVAPAVSPMREYLQALPLRRPAFPVPANASSGFHLWGDPEQELEPAEVAELCRLLSDQIALPVNFVRQVELAYESGIRRFVEIGPGQVLSRLVAEILQGKPFQALAVDPGPQAPPGALRQRLAGLAEELRQPVLFQRKASRHCRRRKVPRPSPRAEERQDLGLEELVRAVIAEVSGHPMQAIGLETDLQGELGLDSLKLVEIVARLRGRALAADHRGFRGLTSVARILQHAADRQTCSSTPPRFLRMVSRRCSARALRGVGWEGEQGLEIRAWSDLSRWSRLARPGPHPRLVALGQVPRLADLAVDVLPRLGHELVALPSGASYSLLTYGPWKDDARSVFLALTAFLRSAQKDLPELALSYHHLVREDEDGVWQALAMGGFGRWRAADGTWHEEALELDPFELPSELPSGQAEYPALARLGPDDLVLVTGGARGIAALCVQSLLERTECRFLLLGRQQSGSELIPEAYRHRVTYERCDLSDPDAVESLQWPSAGVTLVIHAAGVGAMQPFRQRDPAAAPAIFAPKVDGLRHLLGHLRERPRGVVLFSSLAAYCGPSGQADYAAANAALDGLEVRWPGDERPIPSLSIQWTAWGESGMASGADVKAVLETTGLELLSNEEGGKAWLAVLDRWLASPPSGGTTVAVVKGVPQGLLGGTPGFRAGQELRPGPLEAGILVSEHSYPLETAYRVAWSDRLRGALDASHVARALQEMVDAHPALRAAYRLADGGELERRVEHDVALECPQITVDSESDLASKLAELLRQPLRLDQPPLLRGALLRLSETDHTLLVVGHHIALDGGTTRLLRRQFFGRLGQLRESRGSAFKEPAGGAELAAKSSPSELLKSWLAGAPRPFPTPAESRSDVDFRAQSESAQLASKLERGLSDNPYQASPFALLCAAWALAVSRVRQSSPVVFGIALEGRESSQQSHQAGLFANLLPAVISGPEALSRRELVELCGAEIARAVEHQALPLATLVGALDPPRTLGLAPLLTEVLEYQRIDLGCPSVPGLERKFRSYAPDHQLPDLVVSFRHAQEGLSVELRYRPSRLAPESARRLREELISSLAFLLRDTLPGRPGPGDAAEPSAPPARSLPQALDERAARHGARVALDWGGHTMTYSELREASLRAASRLRSLGVGAGDRVVLALPRAARTVAWMWGLLRLGAAYVPLDPDEPPARREELEKLARPRLVVDEEWANAEPLEAGAEPEAGPVVALDSSGPASVAAVMMTSGSTGSPKPVLITQGNILSLAQGLTALALGPEKRVLAASSLAFDASFLELWAALLHGATVVLHLEKIPTLSGLAQTLARGRVSTAWLTSSLFGLIVDERPEMLSSLRELITGGEVVSPTHLRRARRLYPGLRLFNGYGPTECTTFATLHEVSDEELESGQAVPLGKPLPHVQLEIVDESLRPLPAGLEGEIVIGGGGVALGYLEADSAAFLPGPPGPRYRTGDRGCLRADGCLEFRGRMDRQLKIRGFRVEPAEVERHLLALDGVQRCAVTGQTDGTSQALVAYIVSGCRTLDFESLRQELARRLPDFMLPRAFVPLAEIPLGPQGKVNWSALPVAELRGPSSPYRLILPRDPLEELVCAVWEDALKVRLISVTDDFRELGGHSLAALRIVARLEGLLGVHIPVSSLFFACTIESLANLIRQVGWEADWPTLVPMRDEGERHPFFCVHPADGHVFCYRELVEALPRSLPFLALQARGLDGREAPLLSVEEMASCYVASLLARQPHGPFFLGGWSSGGVIAYEMAVQLRRLGHRVGAVCLLDSYFPVGSYPRAERARQELRKTIRDIERVGGDALRHTARVLTDQASVDMETVRHVARLAGRVLLSRVGLAQHQHYQGAAGKGPTQVALTWAALDRYRAGSADFPLLLFQAQKSDLRGSFDGRLAWRKVAPDLRTIPVPGDHYSLLEAPLCARLAKALDLALWDMGCQEEGSRAVREPGSG
jgi:amino acid adenylation domain-containing protein